MINIYEKIVNGYPHSIVKPQNVFTIDNPDMLVPFKGNLIGVFLVKEKEIRQLDLLLRRIYLSKLAYTSAMTPIVLINQDNVAHLGSKTHEILSRFRFVCEYRTTQDIPAIFNEIDNYTMDYFNPYIQSKVIRRLWLIKSFAREYEDMLKHNKFGYVYAKNVKVNNIPMQPWTRNKHSLTNACLVNGDDLLLERESKHGFVSSFESVLTYTMMYNYKLDNGYMLENRINGKNRYLNTNWNFGAVDNPLYFNTLAFLGILPIKIDNMDCIKEIGGVYENYYWKFNKKRE